MRGRPVSVAALALFSCFAVPVSSADAQLASLIPGVRARMRAPGSFNGRLTGMVTNRTADSLSIAMENGVPVQLPLSALTSVDISRGESRSRGAMKGAIWGGGVGLLSGLFSDSGGDSCTKNCASRGEIMAAGVLGLGATGALIGAFVQSERWERLDLPVRTALLRTHGGTTAVVSIGF
jgi:hypothetical protein